MFTYTWRDARQEDSKRTFYWELDGVPVPLGGATAVLTIKTDPDEASPEYTFTPTIDAPTGNVNCTITVAQKALFTNQSRMFFACIVTFADTTKKVYANGPFEMVNV